MIVIAIYVLWKSIQSSARAAAQSMGLALVAPGTMVGRRLNVFFAVFLFGCGLALFVER